MDPTPEQVHELRELRERIRRQRITCTKICVEALALALKAMEGKPTNAAITEDAREAFHLLINRQRDLLECAPEEEDALLDDLPNLLDRARELLG